MSITNPKADIKESGMVAIMVTMILMIVISLIVLGFAQISRRNQRQVLDRQLSSQAFYAAETGVNDAAELIQASAGSIPDKTDCADSGGGFYSSLNGVLSAQNEVEYTCVTVDPDPTNLSKEVGTQGVVFPLTPVSGTISRVNLQWQQTSGGVITSCPADKTSVFSAASSWNCNFGLLRFDLVRTDGSALSSAGLQSNTFTSFVVPLRPGSTDNDGVAANFSTGGSNNLLEQVCGATGCSLQINVPASSQYYIRVVSLYKPVFLQITTSDASGGALELQGAQALIDSTGKAQDVLRRIQVRVPLRGTSNNLLSDWAIQSSEAICKRYSVMDGYFQNDADNVITTNAIPSAGTVNNLLCVSP